MEPMRVTTAELKKMGACSEDVAKFEREFGSYVDVTLETLHRAFGAKVNVGWWAERVFGSAYDEAMAPHRRAYDDAWATHQRAYDEAMAPHRRAYDEAMATHQRAYDEAMATLIVAHADKRMAEQTAPTPA